MTPFKAYHTDRDTKWTNWSCFKMVWKRPQTILSVGTHLDSLV